MGEVIQFRPRARDAVEIKNVRLWPPAHDPATGIQYAMDDDTAPCEANPDPFMTDRGAHD